ncbi:MAG: trigger factor [Holosporales bacterium]
MQITEVSANGLKREYKLVIPAAEMERRIDSRLQEIGKKVKMDGFRAGKVPLPFLKQRYGQSARYEALERAIQDGTNKIIDDHKLRSAGQPQVDVKAADEGKDLEAVVSLEVMPDVEKVDLSKVSVEKYTAAVEAKQIDDVIERFAASSRRTKAIESKRAAKSGDVAIIDFTGKIDGVAFSGGAAKGQALELGSGMFIPGFEEQIIGHKAGESFDIKVMFPEDYGAKNLAGKEAVFEITLHEIREHEETKIDDELAKTMGFEDVKALRSAVEQQLQGEHDRMGFLCVKRQVLDHFAESVKFEVPSTLVAAEFKAIWRQLEQETTRSGEAMPEGDELENLKEQYQSIAERRVRLGLILAEVGREHKVEVPRADIERAIINEARRYPGQEKKVFDYYRNTPQAIAALRAPLFEDKVIEVILEKAKVKVVPISIDELNHKVKELTEGVGEDEAMTAKPAKKGKKAVKGHSDACGSDCGHDH